MALAEAFNTASAQFLRENGDGMLYYDGRPCRATTTL